ncbi:MAG: DUF6159 family protein [Tepidisphaeraceae bacterium]
MFDKISYTWGLMGASWDVLKRDKALVLFPLFSGVCCVLVLASFIIPIFTSDILPSPDTRITQQQQVLYYSILFGFYFCNYFVITFFNTAIIACAMSRMAGGEPTFMGGIREAASRVHLIAGWALVQATVGLVLRIIEDRSPKLGRFIAGILGAVWTVLTYLVVPVMVMENKGPIDAFKESTRLLKKTWGEQIVGNFSFGLIFFLLSLPAVGLVILGFVMGQGNGTIIIACVALAVVYLVVLGLIQSALQAIFQAAVYMYTQGVAGGPQGFPVQLVRGAMAQSPD